MSQVVSTSAQRPAVFCRDNRFILPHIATPDQVQRTAISALAKIVRKLKKLISCSIYIKPLVLLYIKVENKMDDIGYVYILECANGKYYTGSTNDLEIRLNEHKLGMGANFTRKHLPFELVYVEVFDRIDMAFKREKQIQGWSHKKKAALIASDKNSLRKLSECQNDSHANNIYSHDE